jgi:hypothetical protein
MQTKTKQAEDLERDLAESNAGALRVTAAEARFILAGRVFAKADRGTRRDLYIVALRRMLDAARAMMKP